MSRCRNFVRWSWKYLPKNVKVYVSRDWYVVLWSDWFGRTDGGAFGRFVATEFQGQKEEVIARIWEGKMRRKSLEQLRGVRLHGDPKGLLELYPNLAEFMTAGCFEQDGKTELRESPTVTIWCAGGQWRASVKDRAEGLVMWLAAESAIDLLQVLELFVLDADAP